MRDHQVISNDNHSLTLFIYRDVGGGRRRVGTEAGANAAGDPRAAGDGGGGASGRAREQGRARPGRRSEIGEQWERRKGIWGGGG